MPLLQVSTSDPKQRRAANEVKNWCEGDAFKLWNTDESRFVPTLDVPARAERPRSRLVSAPTAAHDFFGAAK